MKKLLNKKNNKGFSLVELIVVVLIMGIIAVALAPQIMKWVNTSRTNTDKNQEATIKSVAQTAVAEYMSEKTLAEGYYRVDKTNQVKPCDSAGAVSATDANSSTLSGGAVGLGNLIKSLLGEYPNPQNGTYFLIHVESTGTVTVEVK